MSYRRQFGIVLVSSLAVFSLFGWPAKPARAESPATRPDVPATGPACGQLASFDRMMRSFVRENEVPGAALAVTRNGKLVYARGFGLADVMADRPVQPDSLFRIASVSKPITAVAMMTLVEQGKVRLESHVFDLLPHKPHLAAGQLRDPRLSRVTVRHLLQHRGGWDRDASGDPMFRSISIAHSLGVSPPARPDDIVRYMLGRPLDFEPGRRYAYSNFGYCLLGRLIEQLTGQTYEHYVQRNVLAPLGVRRMRIGRTLASLRADGEVCYYTRGKKTGPAVVGPDLGARVPLPYGAWYLEAMDAHGGWIASAIDLVRFASAVQQAPKSGLLSRASLEKMFARPPGSAGYNDDGEPKKAYYGFGWLVRPVPPDPPNRWHTGKLAGTSALLVIRHDGLCWAVLFNTSQGPDGTPLAKKIDPLVHQAANAVTDWPERDLFPRFR